MNVTVNGERQVVSVGTTVAALIATLTEDSGGAARGVAVAVNGAVVARGDWQGALLADDDAVEVLTAVQGG